MATYTFDRSLDAVDRHLLSELQADGRVTIAELSRRVSLSAPSVAERVRRLESTGVIRGYSARIDPEALGLEVLAFIRLSPPAASGMLAQRLAKEIEDVPEMLECYHVSGEDCYILKVAVRRVGDLRGLVERLSRLGRTTTSIVLAVLAENRPLVPSAS